MLRTVLSTLLVLVVVVLAGWAVAFALRPPAPARDPQQVWEHWLEDSGLRPVLPRMKPVVAAVTAAGRAPQQVDRAAMGRTRDQCPLVVAALATGEVVVAARRSGPIPVGTAIGQRDGWQIAIDDGPVWSTWGRATWVREGPTVHQ